MKLNEKTRNVQSSMNNAQHFQIKTSAKAFAILSDLYEDKIFAIMRELGTNAYDAHVEAGKGDEPFYVHLPTELESWFAIRDYGLGMDQDTVMRLYTTYFDSSKTGSDDFVGALGLGSKSPFSYTDNFTVESVQDGIKKTYLAYLDDHSTPTISHVGTVETDEPSGVKIQFPVGEYDRRYFSMKAYRVFYPFATLPEINLSNEVLLKSLKDEETILSAEAGNVTFHIIESSDFLDSSIVVNQGNILYPLNWIQLDYEFSESESYFLRKFNNYRYGGQSMIIDVPIGTVDFTPSRESLSYTEHTKRNMIEIVTQIAARYNDLVAEKAKQENSLVESLTYYSANALVGGEEAKQFLEKEKANRNLAGTRYIANPNGFNVDFFYHFFSEEEEKDINTRFGRVVAIRFDGKGFRVENLFKINVTVVKDYTFIYVQPEEVGLEPKQITYRIKRHMKSDKGELASSNNVMLVYDKRILEELEVSHIKFEGKLTTTKHLRKPRTTPSGQPTKKSTVPSYRFRWKQDNSWKTHHEMAKELAGYDEIVYFYEKRNRSQYYTEYIGIGASGNTTSLPTKTVQCMASIPDSERVFGKSVAIVEVEGRQEFTKKRFQKMPTATESPRTLLSDLEQATIAWAQNRPNVMAYVTMSDHNNSSRFLGLASKFVSKFGIDAAAEDSPLRGIANLNSASSQSEVADKLDATEKAIVSEYRYFLIVNTRDRVEETVRQFRQRYVLINDDTFRSARFSDIDESTLEAHALAYMKSVEDAAKAEAEANAVA